MASYTKQFIDDLITMLNGGTEWGRSNAYGVRPRITPVYERKQIGIGQRVGEGITVFIDSEEISPYSVGLGVSSQSWLHTINGKIEVHTNISDIRSRQLTNAVIDIIKRNIAYAGYVSVVVERVRNRDDNTRRYFQKDVYIEGRKNIINSNT